MEKKWTTKYFFDNTAIWGFVLLFAYYFLFNVFGKTDYATTVTDRLIYLRYLTLVLLVVAVLYGVISDVQSMHFIVSFLTGSLLIIAGTFLAFPENEQFPETVSTFYSTVIQLAFLVYLIKDIKKLFVYLRAFSLFASGLLLYYLIIRGVIVNNGRYSMALGYMSLFPAMILFHEFYEHKNVIDLIAALIVSTIIFIFGSRGPLICILLYICYMQLKTMKSKKNLVVIIPLLIFLFFFNDLLINAVQSLFSDLFDSRTMQYIINGQMAEDSGRSIKYKMVFDELNQHPFVIRGINSDYLLLENYTHNIFLELLYEFGYIVGGLICIDLIRRIVITLRHSSDSIESELCLIFMCMAIPQLMVSHSLWCEWTFWAWIALYSRLYSKKITRQKLPTMNIDEKALLA